MRNTWKGLIIGGLTGAGAGAMLDLFGRGAVLLGLVGKKAVEVAPEAMDRVKAAATAAGKKAGDKAPMTAEWMRAAAAAAGTRAADVVPDLADRFKSVSFSGVARARKAHLRDQVSDQAKEMAHHLRDQVSDQAKEMAHRMGGSDEARHALHHARRKARRLATQRP